MFGPWLKPGTNVVVIRVFKTKPDGGFMGKPEDLHLDLGDTPAFRSPASGKAI